MNTNYPLFPGAVLCFVHYAGPISPQQHRHPQARASALEVNYCSRGRLGWHMKNDTSVYLGSGDLSVNAVDFCAHSSVEFPLGYYEGIQVILDFDLLLAHMPPVLQDMALAPSLLQERLFSLQKPLTLPSSGEIQRIFSGMEQIAPALRLSYYRLKAQELLFFLFSTDFSAKKEVNPYQSRQTELIREIHSFLTQNLSMRVTIEELSQKYLINTSTLKEVFKGVYGQPIASYMKEYRLRRAAELLSGSDESVAQIAREVGYSSQSKFSAAFKDYAGTLPTEYRRRKNP